MPSHTPSEKAKKSRRRKTRLAEGEREGGARMSDKERKILLGKKRSTGHGGFRR